MRLVLFVCLPQLTSSTLAVSCVFLIRPPVDFPILDGELVLFHPSPDFLVLDGGLPLLFVGTIQGFLNLPARSSFCLLLPLVEPYRLLGCLLVVLKSARRPTS